MTAARTSSCISARSNAPECTASTRDKRSRSRLSLIAGPASPRRTICAPSDRQRRQPCPLTTDVLAGADGSWTPRLVRQPRGFLLGRCEEPLCEEMTMPDQDDDQPKAQKAAIREARAR